MARAITVTERNVTDYRELFVNRLAYAVQSTTAHSENGRFWYYRPLDKQKRPLALTDETLRRHLEGEITISFYAINPLTQCCKWICIDADYENAVNDLLKLQEQLLSEGVHSAFEQSRRGGHLWIFAEKPLLARHCRTYVMHLAGKLRVPIKGTKGQDSRFIKEGIEIFPKQDEVTAESFGNAMRGPLGVHRASQTRYWFYTIPCQMDDQLLYLRDLPKLREEQLLQFVAAIPPKPPEPRQELSGRSLGHGRREHFQILDHIPSKVKRGRNYYAQCPSCAADGRDKGADNLSISVTRPQFYQCWAGCTNEMIRAALGHPIRRPAAS